MIYFIDASFDTNLLNDYLNPGFAFHKLTSNPSQVLRTI
jgi:hypothetical protein